MGDEEPSGLLPRGVRAGWIKLADELRMLIGTRIGRRPGDLSCPYARGEGTPCIARDGGPAVAEGDPFDACAGCKIPVYDLMTEERARSRAPTVDEPRA